MTSQRERSAGGPDPMRTGNQMFEAGYQQLLDGWKQAQEFWNGVARTWSGTANPWMQPGAGSAESMNVLRELNESAFAVAQAWMRMPLAMISGASNPSELQDAVTRLTQAQGRAYQLWMEALSRSGAPAGGTATDPSKKT
ncbi:MAG: hypothetical protein AB7R89_32825 [Dehalococcoidia bacterium]